MSEGKTLVIIGMTLITDGKTLRVGGGRSPPAAMPQIEKERSWAKPNQLPAGPRKKWPLGRLFSSKKYFSYSETVCQSVCVVKV